MFIFTASIHHILNPNLQSNRVWYLTLNSVKRREGMSEVRGTQGGRNDDLKGAEKEVIYVRDNDPGGAVGGAQEGKIDDFKKRFERQRLLEERVEGRPMNQ